MKSYRSSYLAVIAVAVLSLLTPLAAQAGVPAQVAAYEAPPYGGLEPVPIAAQVAPQAAATRLNVYTSDEDPGLAGQLASGTKGEDAQTALTMGNGGGWGLPARWRPGS